MASSRHSSSSRSTASDSQQSSQTLDVEGAINDLLDIDGAVGAAIVDYESGMTLGHEGGRGLDMELAGAGNTEVVRSKRNIIHDLGIDEEIQDILVSMEGQYHLIRMCQNHEDVFMYVVLDRDDGNLGLARREIDQIDENLVLD